MAGGNTLNWANVTKLAMPCHYLSNACNILSWTELNALLKNACWVDRYSPTLSVKKTRTSNRNRKTRRNLIRALTIQFVTSYRQMSQALLLKKYRCCKRIVTIHHHEAAHDYFFDITVIMHRVMYIDIHVNLRYNNWQSFVYFLRTYIRRAVCPATHAQARAVLFIKVSHIYYCFFWNFLPVIPVNESRKIADDFARRVVTHRVCQNQRNNKM